MEDGIVRFIQAVEMYPVLYDNTDEYYTNRQIQEKAWKEVGREVNMSALSCKEKWKNVRSAFTRYLRQKSTTKKRYYLAEYLEFLVPFTKTRSRRSSGIRSIKDSKEDVIHFTSDRESDTDINELTYCKAEELYVDQNENPYEDSFKHPSPQHPSQDVSTPDTTKANHSNESKKRKEMDPLEVCSVDYDTSKKKQKDHKEDADLHFLKSLLPDMQKMTGSQKHAFKCRMMQIIGEILYESPYSKNQ